MHSHHRQLLLISDSGFENASMFLKVKVLRTYRTGQNVKDIRQCETFAAFSLMFPRNAEELQNELSTSIFVPRYLKWNKYPVAEIGNQKIPSSGRRWIKSRNAEKYRFRFHEKNRMIWLNIRHNDNRRRKYGRKDSWIFMTQPKNRFSEGRQSGSFPGRRMFFLPIQKLLFQ